MSFEEYLKLTDPVDPDLKALKDIMNIKDNPLGVMYLIEPDGRVTVIK